MVVGARCDTTDHLDPATATPGTGDDYAPCVRSLPCPSSCRWSGDHVCFSFVLEGNRWFLRHIEGIVIPITPRPGACLLVSDLPSATKDFARRDCRKREDQAVGAFSRIGSARASRRTGSGRRGLHPAQQGHRSILPPEQAFILYVGGEETRLREERPIYSAHPAPGFP